MVTPIVMHLSFTNNIILALLSDMVFGYATLQDIAREKFSAILPAYLVLTVLLVYSVFIIIA